MADNPLTQWRSCIKKHQKKREIILTFMTPKEITEIAQSPTLKKRTELQDYTKYQRSLDESRFKDLLKFWNNAENHLVDNIVLVVDDKKYPESIDTSAEGQLKFKLQEEKFAEILDGQHRVLGCAKSEKYGDDPLPVTILLKSTFPQKSLGKLFTKLNSEAVPITSVMEMHLKARYGLKPWGSSEAKNAYNSMLDLYDDTSSPIHGNIKLFDESGKDYEGIAIAKTFRDLWNTEGKAKPLGISMPHSIGKNDVFNRQFSYFLKSLIGDDGIWEDAFGQDNSSLKSQNGFWEIFVLLYPSFFKIVEFNCGEDEPALDDWENAISSIKDKEKHLNEFLQWDDYSKYISARQHHHILKLIHKILNFSVSGEGEMEFDIESKLHGKQTVKEYLDDFIGDFDLIFYEEDGKDDKGKKLYRTVTEPSTLEFHFKFTTAELAKTEGSLSLFRHDNEKGWIRLFKGGKYNSGIRHPFTQKLKGSLKEELKKDVKYKFEYTASTMSTDRKKSFEFTIKEEKTKTSSSD